MTLPPAETVQETDHPVSDRSAARRRRRPSAAVLVVAAGLVALVAAAVLAVAGGSFAPVALVTGLIVVLAIGQGTSWMFAVAGTPVLALTALMIGSVAFPLIGIGLTAGNVILALAAGLAGLAALTRKRSNLRLPSRGGLVLAAATALPSVVMLGGYAVANARAVVPKVAWMMNNDAVWNLMVTRTFNIDGGFLPVDRPNVSPGTFIVMSAFTDPGRGALAPQELLGHELGRVAWALLLITAVASVLFGLIAAQLVPSQHWIARAVLAGVIGVVPWTWACLGFAARYGFWNAIITPVLLAAAWMLWVEAERRPRAASALMALVGLGVLTIWVPLIILPGLMGVAIVLRHWRTHLALRGWSLLLWLLPLVLLAGWYVVAMRPAFELQSTALAFDGAMFIINQSGVVVGLLVTFGLAAVAAALRGRPWALVGTALILLTAALGMYYLMKQREGAVTGLWGYYPAKFAWLVLLLAVPISVALAASLLSTPIRPRLRRAGLVAGSILVSLGVLVHIPPADLHQATAADPAISATPDWRPVTLFPVWSISRLRGSSAYDPAAAALAQVSEPGSKTYFWKYFREGAYEIWANFWLLQIGARDGGDPIRAYAYQPTPSMKQLCNLIDAWQGEVTLITRDPSTERRVGRNCPDSDFRVELR